MAVTTDPAATLRNPNQDDVEIDNINDKISESQLLINETVAIMDNNIQVLYGREAMLGELEERAAHLAVDATTFQNRSNHLKQNLCKENFKLIVIIAVLCSLAGLIGFFCVT